MTSSPDVSLCTASSCALLNICALSLQLQLCTHGAMVAQVPMPGNPKNCLSQGSDRMTSQQHYRAGTRAGTWAPRGRVAHHSGSRWQVSLRSVKSWRRPIPSRCQCSLPTSCGPRTVHRPPAMPEVREGQQ